MMARVALGVGASYYDCTALCSSAIVVREQVVQLEFPRGVGVRFGSIWQACWAVRAWRSFAEVVFAVARTGAGDTIVMMCTE